MQIAKWGNSLAVRLPTKVCHELGLKEGDSIQLVPSSTRQVFELIPQKTASQILDEIRGFRGHLDSDNHLTRDEANAR